MQTVTVSFCCTAQDRLHVRLFERVGWFIFALLSRPVVVFINSSAQSSPILLCSECCKNSMTPQIHLSSVHAAEHDHSDSPSLPALSSHPFYISFLPCSLPPSLSLTRFSAFLFMVHIKTEEQQGEKSK